MERVRRRKIMTTRHPHPQLGPHHFRSLLFIKASASPERIRSIAPGVTLILDLEDGVSVDRKSWQRQQLRRFFRLGLFRDRTVLLRINGPDQPEEMRRDLEACIHPDLDGVLFPMVQSAEEVEQLAEQLGRKEAELSLPNGRIAVVPLIERPGAILALEGIARSSERIVGLVFGHVDYCVEMHAEMTEECYGEAQGKLLQVARALQLAAVSTLYLQLDDAPGFREHGARMKRRGFDGCLALTPSQAEAALGVFSPTLEELEHARRVVAAVEEQGNIAVLNGRMIGPPMLKKARRILAQHALQHREVA
jgi:citrate lyase subunit beta/citryl-CoA lyase